MTAAPWSHQALAVMSGAAGGALLRWQIGVWLNPLWAGFPLGTLLVNALGGLLIGALTAWFVHHPHQVLHLLLVTGFLGGMTTFSAFSIESLSLLQRGAVAHALIHSAVHLLGSLACASIGWWIGHGFVRSIAVRG